MAIPFVAEVAKFLYNKGLKRLSVEVARGGKEALKQIGNIVGIDIDSPSALMDAIQDPENFQALLALEGKIEVAYLADRQSARDKEVAITKSTGEKDYFMYILAGVFVSGFFALLIFLALSEIPEGSQTLMNMAVGALIAIVTSIAGYFFGSSKGSSDKNMILATFKKAIG